MKSYPVNLIKSTSKALNNPDTKVNFGNKEMSVSDFRKLMSNSEYNPGTEINRMFVMWDDILQLTSLGLILFLIEKEFIKLEEGKTIDFGELVDSFTTRPYEKTDSLDLVEDITGVEKKILKNILKKHYSEILDLSPKTMMWTTLNSTAPILNEIIYVFKYDFDGRDDLINEILENMKKYVSSTKFPRLNSVVLSDTELKVFLRNNKKYNNFIVNNIEPVMEHILNNHIVNTEIIAPNGHNGLDDGSMYYISNMNFEIPIYNMRFSFYEEGVIL